MHVTVSDSDSDSDPDARTPARQVLGTIWLADEDPDVALAARSPDAYYLDSGATVHVARDRIQFREYTNNPGCTIQGVGGHDIAQLGQGTIKLLSHVDQRSPLPITLQHVAHIPSATHNLISVSRITETGAHVSFKGNTVEIRSAEGQLLLTGTKSGRLYKLNVSTDYDAAFVARDAPRTWDDWHRVYGHINYDYLRLLARKGLVTGMTVDETAPATEQCRACIEAKQRVRPFPKMSFTQVGHIGDLVVCDMWGPARYRGAHGEYYFTLITDVKTRYAMRYFSSDKKHQLNAIRAYRSFLKTQKNIRLKTIRVDNGKEFVNRPIKQFLRSHGIRLELTAPHSSAQNGIAERSFLTVLNAARAMLFESNLPIKLWPEAVNYAVYLKNRAPTRALPNKTPFEAFWGRKPDVSHLREFGATCWVLRQDTGVHKLMRKSRPCHFIGFSEESRAYRLYDPATGQIITSRNVVFERTRSNLEGETPSLPPLAVEGEQPTLEQSEQPPEVSKSLDAPTVSAPAPVTPAPKPSNSAAVPGAPTKPSPSQIPIYTRALRRTGANVDYRKLNNPDARKPAPRFQVPTSSAPMPDNPPAGSPATVELAQDDQDFIFVADTSDDPQSLAEAQARPDWPEWKAVMDREIAQLQRLGTYTLTACPPDRKPIGCKWVFRIKRDAAGHIIKYKARLIAQGFSQIPGVDYIETFAPVVRLETLRILLAIATLLDLDVHVVDIVGAYLNGRLREEIYMRQPPLYENGHADVCRLHRTLYGLKQSGREWNLELDTAFKKLRFMRLISDQCVYIRTATDALCIVAVHVDDMTMLTSSAEATAALKRELAAHFEISDPGPIRQVVGLEVTRDRSASTLALRQSQHIDRILAHFGMTEANPVDTPLDPHVCLRAHDGPENSELRALYQAIVGSLMYAALGTRPDIAHAVQQLSQYSSNPAPVHLTAAKRVLRYLKGTRNLGITYHRNQDNTQTPEPIGYSDADWGNDLDDRRSISGQVFLLAGGPVTWACRKQRTVAKSSIEAEYMAASTATSEIAWLRTFLRELGFPLSGPTPLYVDNQSAIASANAQASHAHTKHIDIHYHFVRERITSNEVTVLHCSSEDNLADALTKALPRPRFQALVARMGMRA
ncbi:hypothetical protein ACG7TL_001677 [Trametes sanguinea]